LALLNGNGRVGHDPLRRVAGMAEAWQIEAGFQRLQNGDGGRCQ
jgi:hypothetical protein